MARSPRSRAVLDVGMDYFIATPSLEDSLTRAAERQKFSVDGSSVLYERIAADFAGNMLSSFILNIPPGYHSETVSHEGEEILYVLEGHLTHTLDGMKWKSAPATACIFAAIARIPGGMTKTKPCGSFGPARCPSSGRDRNGGRYRRQNPQIKTTKKTRYFSRGT